MAEATSDTRREMLTRRNPLPEKARAVFGEKHMDRFLELLGAPILREADEMLVIQGVSSDVVTEYLIQMPAFQELQMELKILAYHLLKELQSKPEYYVKSSFDRRGIAKVNSKIFDVLFLLFHVTLSQEYECGSFRNKLLDDFFYFAGFLIFNYCLLQCQRLDAENPTASLGENKIPSRYEQMLDLIAKMSAAEADTTGRSYGLLFVYMIIAFRGKKVFSDHAELFQFVDDLVPRLGQSENGLEQLNRRRFPRLQEKALFKAIDPYEKVYFPRRLAIQLLPEANETQARESKIDRIALVRLAFDESPIPERDADGKIHHGENSLLIQVNMADGSLSLAFSNIPLQVVMKSTVQYEVLRMMVYETLETFFDSKKDDLEELCVSKHDYRPASPAQRPMEETREAVATTLTPADEEQERKWKDDAKAMAMKARDEARAKASERLQPVPAPVDPEKEERIRRLYDAAWARIKQATNQQIINAMTKILGPPVTITGSHHKFRKRNGGGTDTIPFHPHQTIGIGLIKKVCRRLEVSALELQVALDGSFEGFSLEEALRAA